MIKKLVLGVALVSGALLAVPSPAGELWVVLRGTEEIAIVDTTTGSLDPAPTNPIGIADPDGDSIPDPPWGLTFSTAVGFNSTHAFVTQQGWLSVISVPGRTRLHAFDVADLIGAESLDLRGCHASVPRRFIEPASGMSEVRNLVHCAGTDGSGNAVFVVLDQNLLIAGPPNDPLVDHGVLGPAVGIDVVTLDTPRGVDTHARAWYASEQVGAVVSTLQYDLVAAPDTLPVDFSVRRTRTTDPVATLFPENLRISAATGGQLPAAPQRTLGRLEHLGSGGGCDIGGELVAMSVTGIGVESYTVLAIDRAAEELLVVDATQPTGCVTHAFATGSNPVHVVTLGEVRWRTAYVANHDDDTLTVLDQDGSPPGTIALGPLPSGGSCDRCPITMGVPEEVSQDCEAVELQVDKVDTDMSGGIDRIVLTWQADCESPVEMQIGCRCVDENDAACPCRCDCILQPEVCACPGIQSMGLGPDPGQIENTGNIALQDTPDTIDETPWIILGFELGLGGMFQHDIPDGNASDVLYSVEPVD